jgi:hypothetical protein
MQTRHFRRVYHPTRDKLLIYADYVNLLGDNADTTKKSTEIIIDASKEVGLVEENAEKLVSICCCLVTKIQG